MKHVLVLEDVTSRLRRTDDLEILAMHMHNGDGDGGGWAV